MARNLGMLNAAQASKRVAGRQIGGNRDGGRVGREGGSEGKNDFHSSASMTVSRNTACVDTLVVQSLSA